MKQIVLTLMLAGATAIWGWTFVAVKEAVGSYSVLGFLGIRFALAAILLLPLAVRKMTRRSLAVGLGIGAVMALGYLLQTFGLRQTTPTNAGLITGLFVVFGPVFARVLYRVRTGRALAVSIVLSVVGMALLTGRMPGQLGRGDFLILGCAFAFGLHVALLSRHAPEHDAVALALAQMVATAALCGLAWPAFERLVLPTREVWWTIVVTAVLASALAFYVQTRVQQQLSAARTAVVLALEPVFAAFFGYWLAGDRLRLVQALGGLCILGAVALQTAASLRRPPEGGTP